MTSGDSCDAFVGNGSGVKTGADAQPSASTRSPKNALIAKADLPGCRDKPSILWMRRLQRSYLASAPRGCSDVSVSERWLQLVTANKL